jgi:hypothetical protein
VLFSSCFPVSVDVIAHRPFGQRNLGGPTDRQHVEDRGDIL